MSPDIELSSGLIVDPAFQEGFDPKRDLDAGREDLTAEQREFVRYAKSHEGRFDIYGVDPSQNFMVTGMKHERGVKTFYRQFFTPADPNNPYSLSHIFPFNIDKDIILTEENDDVRVNRIINYTPDGKTVNAYFGNSRAESISLNIGKEHIGITYVKGRFSYFSFFDEWARRNGQSQAVLEPGHVGRLLPEVKWHRFEYLDGGETLLFKGVYETVQARIPMSVNRHLIIGGLLSPQMRQDPSNFSPDMDEYWKRADLTGLFGIKIEEAQSAQS